MAMPSTGTYAKNGEKTGSNGLVRWLVTYLLITVEDELPIMLQVPHYAHHVLPELCHLSAVQK